MREVDVHVARWQESVAPLFRDREEVLDELESHLLDESDRLTENGSPPDEAVRAAAGWLGVPGEIAAEFSKLPPRVTPWLPVRVVCVAGAFWSALVLWPLSPRLFADAGLTHGQVLAVEGPAWLLQDFDAHWDDPGRRERLLDVVRRVEADPSLLGASAHLLAVARK